MHERPHPPLARGKVRCVGEQVAVVIAETYAQAKDAAERIVVDYTPLPPVVDMNAALAGGPLVHDEIDTNPCFDWALGAEAQMDAAFANAAHVKKITTANTRLNPHAYTHN